MKIAVLPWLVLISVVSVVVYFGFFKGKAELPAPKKGVE